MSGPRVYYNEIEPYAAQWLRNLIDAGLIAPGDVDERSIEDVRPSDIADYTQCHWFAGIGIWSYALRQAGWPDDRPVWTGSCPCQPFSQAGKGGGFADKRHLWPAWFWLIEQCGPGTIFGEQVANALDWLDLVSTDLEGAGYAVGAIDTCAAGFGAPHIRQRLWWVADTEGERRGEEGRGSGRFSQRDGDCGESNGLAHSISERRGGRTLRVGASPKTPAHQLASTGGAGRLADSEVSERWGESSPDLDGRGTAEAGRSGASDGASCSARDRLPTVWDQVDWVLCRDPGGLRWRPVNRGTFPLGARHPGDVARLRAYGNALVAPQAEAFVRAYMLREVVR
ncbi:MAG TPA: DNA cytosine methyltransferase [Anaerolineae bacterium]|nr:DNA cytosine methyltransferase [Anaerolineae bacterium]